MIISAINDLLGAKIAIIFNEPDLRALITTKPKVDTVIFSAYRPQAYFEPSVGEFGLKYDNLCDQRFLLIPFIWPSNHLVSRYFHQRGCQTGLRYVSLWCSSSRWHHHAWGQYCWDEDRRRQDIDGGNAAISVILCHVIFIKLFCKIILYFHVPMINCCLFKSCL